MVDQNYALDLSGVEASIAWVKAKKNFLLGLALVVLLAIGATQFVRAQMHAAAMRPWSELVKGKNPWLASVDELASVRQRLEQTPAEPVALYWEALQRYANKDTAGAVASLDALKSKFPNHALCTTKLLDVERPQETRSPVERMLASIQRMEQWDTQYKAPTANPLPKTQFSVTLITERGSIVLALYNDLAPKSSEAFLKVAPQLKDSFIAKALPEQWIEIGQDHEGNPVAAKEVSGEFPPYEPESIRSLYHFADTVAFRQPPFQKGTASPDLHVTLKNDFDQDGRSCVFAVVVQGSDILISLSKEPKSTNKPQMLATPIKITEVKIDRIAAAESSDKKPGN